MVQVTTPIECAQLPVPMLALWKVVLAGSVSTSVTPVAWSGPMLATVSV
jgi:hypothetical protein